MDKIIFNFYSRASCEARQNCTASSPIFKIFLLTRLLRGATNGIYLFGMNCRISTHAPLARRDAPISAVLSRSSISTHAPLARRDCDRRELFAPHPISTHAPLARRDGRDFRRIKPTYIYFYSRASCEARLPLQNLSSKHYYFYSRASCEARPTPSDSKIVETYFYSRASCEARLYLLYFFKTTSPFLLTRLLRGATGKHYFAFYAHRFLLTRLLRGATPFLSVSFRPEIISTHAPLARRDRYN